MEPLDAAVVERARAHAALGEPVRLAIVDELARSDRSPSELAHRFGLAGNLLAHHLDVLEAAGLVERVRSSGDGRRRYVTLRRPALDRGGDVASAAERPVLFVCTHNSARSQLAAALWRRRTGRSADSAGTHPAPVVHPGATAAARRAGLDLGGARPKALDDAATRGATVVTVCDRAHEELDAPPSWWHWSVRDPVEAGTASAFDAALRELADRIDAVVPPADRSDRPAASPRGAPPEERP